MKLFGLLSVFLFLSMYGCTQTPDCNKLLGQIEKDITAGNLKHAKLFADSVKKLCPGENQLFHKADSLSQIAERIAIDFSLSEEQIIQKLNKNTGIFSPEDKASWEKLNWLEYRIIDGEKRYFKRAASNLILIKNFHIDRANRDSLEAKEKKIIFRKDHTKNIIRTSGSQALPVVPVEMKIDYTIVIKADAVPAGETVRCWMPWPKESHPRQQNIKLISTSHDNYKIAPDSEIHRTIYMEAKSEKGFPTVFRASYSYRSSGQYFDMKNLKIKPYDRTSALYKMYTSEELPQICFTEKVKHLADSITGYEQSPVEIVKKIFYWFNKNIPWAGALEYSIMPNIPEYVLQFRKGDCGMQTFLFMSMLRYKGIPVKWQSGWMVPPGDENLHDWCEVYYEGAGWIPVDISYGLQYSDDQRTKEFYISGIDSYRLTVNDGISGTLFPAKNFLRSDPFDFQRGEVEWNGGNLYFDKWDYDMKIEYKAK
jgi:transglutaminase-like putative cysteine protease